MVGSEGRGGVGSEGRGGGNEGLEGSEGGVVEKLGEERGEVKGRCGGMYERAGKTSKAAGLLLIDHRRGSQPDDRPSHQLTVVRQPNMTPSPKRRALNGVKHHTELLLLQCAIVADADDEANETRGEQQ